MSIQCTKKPLKHFALIWKLARKLFKDGSDVLSVPLFNRAGGAVGSALASQARGREFEPRPVHLKKNHDK